MNFALSLKQMECKETSSTYIYIPYISFCLIRSCREELQAWGRGPDPEHYHGFEGPHEDQREEQAGDI